MNYIRKLQNQREQLIAEKREGLAALQELEAYLHSEKFRTDTTVQVADVLARMAPAKSALIGEILD